MTPIEFYLFIIPLVSGVGILMITGVRKDMIRRREKLVELQQDAEQLQAERAREAQLAEQERIRRLIAESHIPDGTVDVCDRGVPHRKGLHLPGSLMVEFIGTPGANRGLQFLIRLDQAGFADIIGSGLVVESDDVQREKFQDSLPRVYHDRFIYARLDQYTGGFANKPVIEVRHAIGHWGVAIAEATRETVLLHQRRTTTRPGEVLMFTTLGGHTYPGVIVAQTTHTLLPTTQLVACLDLPDDEPQRDDFLTVKSWYEASGVFGWIVSDALEYRSASADTALADLLVGLYAATLQSDKSPRLNNVITRVLPEQPGGMALYQFLYSQVVAYPFQPHESVPVSYYVSMAQVRDELKTLIDYMEQGRGFPSLRVPAGEERRATYDLVLAAINPTEMLNAGDYIEEARRLEASVLIGANHTALFHQPNYHTLYASYAPPVDPAEPFCQVAVIRLRSVYDWKRNLPEIVKAPDKRQLTTMSQPALLAPGMDGVHNEEADDRARERDV
jgi:hypothetical protein